MFLFSKFHSFLTRRTQYPIPNTQYPIPTAHLADLSGSSSFFSPVHQTTSYLSCLCGFLSVSGFVMEELESCVPPGFRFHPTEEELVGYYLSRKVASMKIDVEVISDVDLYKIEPWDLQDRCKYGHEDQKEWYFFSHKDKKYPTGTRTNRATAAGFWKATGRDKAVISKSKIIGMRKTLVFYQGRAPNGRKSDWIMHEYSLQSTQFGLITQEEGWVVCKAFRKPSPSDHRQQQQQHFNPWNNNQFAYQIRDQEQMQTFPVDIKKKTPQLTDSNILIFKPDRYDLKQLQQIPTFNHEQQQQQKQLENPDYGYPFFELPNLDSDPGSERGSTIPVAPDVDCGGQPIIDWKALDRLLLGSQFLNEPNSSTNSNFGLITLDYETDHVDHSNHGSTDLFSTSISN